VNNLLASQTNPTPILLSVDEMTPELLDDVLLFASSPLVYLLLIGEPSLLTQLNTSTKGRNFSASLLTITLRTMTMPEMLQYLDYRLSLVSVEPAPALPKALSQFLYMRSGGSPRLIGVYYHNALLLAFLRQQKELSADIFRLAMKSDTFLVKESALNILKNG
jgi:type II secretory pathway predicted ATPase ExeA